MKSIAVLTRNHDDATRGLRLTVLIPLHGLLVVGKQVLIHAGKMRDGIDDDCFDVVFWEFVEGFFREGRFVDLGRVLLGEEVEDYVGELERDVWGVRGVVERSRSGCRRPVEDYRESVRNALIVAVKSFAKSVLGSVLFGESSAAAPPTFSGFRYFIPTIVSIGRDGLRIELGPLVRGAGKRVDRRDLDDLFRNAEVRLS